MLLFYMIVLTCVFSTCDAVLTIIEIESGWAYEANPIMAFFYNIHPLFFFTIKTIMVFGALLFFWKHQNRALARASIVGSLVIYSFIMGWHAYGLVLHYE